MAIPEVALKVKEGNLTYLTMEKLDSLYNCIDEVNKSNIEGDFTEYGVALGGSGICLSAALGDGRRYFGFDVFGMIPPPSNKDGERVQGRYKRIKAGKSKGINGDKYYGYIKDLYSHVKENFTSFGYSVDSNKINLVQGLFSDTLPLHEDLRISLAHIDCDWYDPVAFCLNFNWPRLSNGGFIILDDYNDWAGCKKAADEFVARTPGVKVIRRRPHAVIQKQL